MVNLKLNCTPWAGSDAHLFWRLMCSLRLLVCVYVHFFLHTHSDSAACNPFVSSFNCICSMNHAKVNRMWCMMCKIWLYDDRKHKEILFLASTGRCLKCCFWCRDHQDNLILHSTLTSICMKLCMPVCSSNGICTKSPHSAWKCTRTSVICLNINVSLWLVTEAQPGL